MSTTNVLSFTHINSGGLTGLNSGFIYAENSGSSYRSSLFTMNEFAGFDGAMWVQPNSHECDLNTVLFTANASVVYDTGSWTNPLSQGAFYNAKAYTAVQIGLSIFTSSIGQDVSFQVLRNGNDQSLIMGWQDYNNPLGASQTFSAGFVFSFIGQAVPVNSGDRITVRWGASVGGAYTHSSDLNVFWIRGLQR